jgi:DMSO/TMAO reductase YedYZ molybdopterin-dependent catalytic subunit
MLCESAKRVKQAVSAVTHAAPDPTVRPAQATRFVFWETFGYHNYGDPWLVQRYAGD